jgi:hypothetical protein
MYTWPLRFGSVYINIGSLSRCHLALFGALLNKEWSSQIKKNEFTLLGLRSKSPHEVSLSLSTHIQIIIFFIRMNAWSISSHGPKGTIVHSAWHIFTHKQKENLNGPNLSLYKYEVQVFKCSNFLSYKQHN